MWSRVKKIVWTTVFETCRSLLGMSRKSISVDPLLMPPVRSCRVPRRSSLATVFKDNSSAVGHHSEDHRALSVAS